MTIFLVVSVIVMLLVVDAFILAGKLDFLVGRSLKYEMYGNLPRLRVITALSVSLSAICKGSCAGNEGHGGAGVCSAPGR